MTVRITHAVALALAAVPAAQAAAHQGHHLAGTMHYDAPATGGKASGRSQAVGGAREWLAGDHHVHSEFSADYKSDPADPAALPTPLFGKDGRYSIRRNAEMARSFGLAWMVSTDHGGPGHSRINHDIAYPSLVEARAAVPDLMLFFGMEFDTPGGDHSSLIVPRSPEERGQLRELEASWSQRESWPADPARDHADRMIAALKVMRAQPRPPLLIARLRTH